MSINMETVGGDQLIRCPSPQHTTHNNNNKKMKTLCQLCLLLTFLVAKSVANVVVTSSPLYLSKHHNVVVLKCIAIHPGLPGPNRVTFSANEQTLFDSDKNFSAPNVKVLNETSIELSEVSSELTAVHCSLNGERSVNPFFVPYIDVERYEHNPRKLVINQKFAATCSLNMRPYNLIHPSRYTVDFLHNGTMFARYSVVNNNVVNFETKRKENQGFHVERGSSIYPEYSVWVNPYSWWADGSYRCSISMNTTIKVDSDEIDANKASLIILSTVVIAIIISVQFYFV